MPIRTQSFALLSTCGSLLLNLGLSPQGQPGETAYAAFWRVELAQMWVGMWEVTRGHR